MSTLATLSLLLLAQGPTAPVEVPFKIGEEAIIVSAKVNGRPLSLMFDTGFSGGVIVGSGINLGKPTGKMTLRDFVGTFQADTTKITSFQLGPLNIDTADLEAVSDPSGGEMSQTYNVHCDGIMGLEPLTDYVFEINIQKSCFIFYPRSTNITSRTPDNKKTFLAKLLPTGHNSLEMEVTPPTGKRMTMALDTGNMFFAATHRDVLERVGLWPAGTTPKFMKASMVASGEVSSWYKQMKDMTIFGIPVGQSTWSVIDAPSSSAESDGTIGFGFLKNFNTTVDFERRRVWFENFTGKVENEEDADVGISAAFDPRALRVRVFRVAPDSPADKAGIKRGDTILSIDGVDELNVGWRRLNKMLVGEKGSKVKLAISRNGALIRFEVQREHLINP